MSDQDLQRTYRRVPLGGLVLLFLGIVFLLQTLDVLPWALWGTLWRFWPVLIVAVGLGILLGRQNPWFVGVLILSLLFACLGLAIWQYEQVPEPVIERYSEPLASLEHTHIEMDFNGGSLSISSLANNSPNFVEIDSEARCEGVGLTIYFTEYDGEGTLHLSTEGVSRLSWVEPWVDCEVRLTRDIPLELDIDSAASNLELDLSELQITELRMDMNAGNYKITTPFLAGEVFIKLDVTLPHFIGQWQLESSLYYQHTPWVSDLRVKYEVYPHYSLSASSR